MDFASSLSEVLKLLRSCFELLFQISKFKVARENESINGSALKENVCYFL